MNYVLAISIGPVAHFIAAGRRSRDLWYGSTWLSKTTTDVAKFLQTQPGVENLLSPTKSRLESMERAPAQKHGARVSNKILALVAPNAGGDPQKWLQALAAKCRERAREFLITQLERVLSEIDDKDDVIVHRGAFRAQIKSIRDGDFLEFAAAWAPAPRDQDPFFGKAVARACELRDRIPKLFVQPSFSRRGVARSDLDEGRDTVLWPEKQGHENQVRRKRAQLGIIESEELDAIGLLRRLAPRLGNARLGKLPFPPVTRVAVDAWLQGCANSPNAEPTLRQLQRVVFNAETTQKEDFYIWCTPSDEPADGKNRFGYEASVLLEGGCDALRKSVEHELMRAEPAIDKTLQEVNGLVRKLHGVVGLPIPYYAFIEMDGDGIGALLQAQEDFDSYQTCVAKLDRFADDAAKAIESQGTAFYVAADELAAYVPLDKALGVVHDVAVLFAKHVDGKTMSAGIVFAHARDDLRGVRQAARDALGDAKEARRKAGAPHDGYVCLREMPRAGSVRETIGPLADIHKEMGYLVKAILEGNISLRTEQHLRDHLARFGDVKSTEQSPAGVLLARDAVRRQFRRSGDSESDPLHERIESLRTWNDVEKLANEIRMASRIADVQAQRGKTT